MKISEFFPKRYATGEDLGGKPFTFTVRTVELEQMHPQPGSPATEKPVIYFAETKRGIILSAPLARQLAALLGDDTATWTGRRVTIFPQPMNVAGQARVAIRARAATNGASQPPATLATEDEEE